VSSFTVEESEDYDYLYSFDDFLGFDLTENVSDNEGINFYNGSSPLNFKKV